MKPIELSSQEMVSRMRDEWRLVCPKGHHAWEASAVGKVTGRKPMRGAKKFEFDQNKNEWTGKFRCLSCYNNGTGLRGDKNDKWPFVFDKKTGELVYTAA